MGGLPAAACLISPPPHNHVVLEAAYLPLRWRYKQTHNRPDPYRWTPEDLTKTPPDVVLPQQDLYLIAPSLISRLSMVIVASWTITVCDGKVNSATQSRRRRGYASINWTAESGTCRPPIRTTMIGWPVPVVAVTAVPVPRLTLPLTWWKQERMSWMPCTVHERSPVIWTLSLTWSPPRVRDKHSPAARQCLSPLFLTTLKYFCMNRRAKRNLFWNHHKSIISLL